MSDSEPDKKLVYLAYRDIFKDKLAKLRKRNKVRNVVEKHEDHLHHTQLAARLFESESAARAAFPTLFSPRELGNDTALVVKCTEDGFEGGCGQRDGTNPDASPFPDILRSPDTPMPNGASSESVPTVKQHCTNRKSGRIRKQPAQATTWAKLQVGEGKEVTPKGVFRE
ncbi:hypothetical protein DL98DRAFT_543076, partial [Cadophora sp. DSE1049]